MLVGIGRLNFFSTNEDERKRFFQAKEADQQLAQMSISLLGPRETDPVWCPPPFSISFISLHRKQGK